MLPKEAVVYYARFREDFVIGDLLKNFIPAIVAKFVNIYSGQYVHVPNVLDIWKTHRNVRIKEEMDKVDPTDLRAVREKKRELARFFGCSFSRISAVYTKETEREFKEKKKE